MLKKCIGIISYLPDNEELRNIRLNKLVNLIKTCLTWFDLPIIIIAQNWQGINFKNELTDSPIIEYNYGKLGINGARETLRQKFIESEYDYMITLDDDVCLQGSKDAAEELLKLIDENPDKWAYWLPHSLDMLIISKEMYKKFKFPEGGADCKDKRLRFFEDIYFQEAMSKVYGNREFKITQRKLWPSKDAAFDSNNSGWHDEIYDSEGKWIRQDTGDSTRFMVTQATEDTLIHPEKYIRRLDAEIMPTKYKYLFDRYINDWPDHIQDYLKRRQLRTSNFKKLPAKKKKKRK